MQSSYIVNMFDNYLEKYPERLEIVDNTEDAVKFVLDLLDEFDIQLFFDPSRKEPEKKKGEDDLFIYCQVRSK